MEIKDKIIYYKNKYTYSCLQKTLQMIDGKIPYSLLKGDVLSLQAYQILNQRNYNDVDILIPRKYLQLLDEILRENGYVQNNHSRHDEIFLLSCSHQTFPYYCMKNNIILDINHDIFWGEYQNKRIDIKEFLSDAMEMVLYGVKVKTLPPLKTMIQLILHHYKDMNSIYLLATRKSIRYDMFKDIYYLLKNNLDTITVDKLYAMSAEYEIIPYVYYVLYYTEQIFDDEILKQYVEAFRTVEGEALLNCYGLCEKERKEWKYDFKSRLESEELYSLIKDDLNEHDLNKISINKRIFMGVSE